MKLTEARPAQGLPVNGRHSFLNVSQRDGADRSAVAEMVFVPDGHLVIIGKHEALAMGYPSDRFTHIEWLEGRLLDLDSEIDELHRDRNLLISELSRARNTLNRLRAEIE